MIETLEQLRALYDAPRERAVKKQLGALDVHCLRFVELSPFLVISTASRAGDADASPRGGLPGFVRAPDAHTLLVPDSPGNNRLDSLTNVIETGRAGLLFLIPGVDETLRVNGAATLDEDVAQLGAWPAERRAPKLVIRIAVREVYLHCAKALMRSRLWSPEARVERSVLPTMGRMLASQTGLDTGPETQQEMISRYAKEL